MWVTPKPTLEWFGQSCSANREETWFADREGLARNERMDYAFIGLMDCFLRFSRFGREL